MSNTGSALNGDTDAAVEAVACALWDDDEERGQRADLAAIGRAADKTPWRRAHELDRAEYREKAAVAIQAMKAAT